MLNRRKSRIIFEKQHKLPQTQILDNSLAESLHFRHDIPSHGEVLGPDKLIYQDTKETRLRFHRFNKKDSFTYEETPLPWHFTDAIQRAQHSKSGVKFNEHVWMITPQDTDEITLDKIASIISDLRTTMKANDLYSFQLGNYKADTEEEHQQLREEAAKGSFIPLENNLKYTSRMYTYDDLTFENVYNDLMNFYSKYVPSSGEFEHNEPDFHNIFLRATLFIHPEGPWPILTFRTRHNLQRIPNKLIRGTHRRMPIPCSLSRYSPRSILNKIQTHLPKIRT